MSIRALSTEDRLPIERKVCVRREDGSLSEPELISHYNDAQAWVLLGDPGAGKTDAFQALSQAENGYYVSARDFVDKDLPSNYRPPIFIDGLDEISSSPAMGTTALGQIRGKLQRLGTPKFRISCREADWRGSADSAALQRDVGAANFLELHLQPLSPNDTLAMVMHWKGTDAPAAKAFITEAKKRDLDGLLDNPQNLRMLVEATETAEGWPEDKTQTYTMACAKLVQERNREWLANTRNARLPDDEVLQAASYLCALMLLSGGTSISIQPPGGDHQPGVVALPALPTSESAPNKERLQAALSTRLFKGDGSGNFSPVHRTVAEYLGAQYLAKRITHGLPLKRVLALMLGVDGGVVPGLRGLHAWLAAVASGDLRTGLIDRDPLGVIVNGDVRSFTRPEKLRVLTALGNEAKRYAYFRIQSPGSQSLGALATADMEEDFRNVLKSADRSAAHLALVECILNALANGSKMPGLKAELEPVIRDAKICWPRLRTEALLILVALERGDGQWPVSKQLLADIHTGKVEDSEDELLGHLLAALYPGQISAAQIWAYFRRPKSGSPGSSYWDFWHDLAEKIAPQDDTPSLLDALIDSGFQLGNQLDPLGSASIVGELLVKGVCQHGLQTDTPRLYLWLSFGLAANYVSPLKRKHKDALGEWLGDHPDQYKKLFEFGLHLLAAPGTEEGFQLWKIYQHLYDAAQPPEAAKWYLALAEKTSAEDLRHELVNAARESVKAQCGQDAELQLLEAWLRSHPADAAWINGLLQTPYPPDDSLREISKSGTKQRQYMQQQEQQKLEFFARTLPSFKEGPADLAALLEIGNAYINFFHRSSEKTAEARVLELLSQNQEWNQLAFHGLRQCLFRADLPKVKEVIALKIQGSRYNLLSPCLAAMELRYVENAATALDLPEPILETVTAFALTHNYDASPDWFKHLIATRSEIVARVIALLIQAQITTKKDNVNGLYALAHDPLYSKIAAQITPFLIDNFQRKAQKNQLQSLRLLVTSLMVNLDGTTQLEIIDRKLKHPSSDVAQRVYWFTAGLQLAPDIYLESAMQYIGKTEARVGHLIALVNEQRNEGRPHAPLPVAALEFLIALLGPGCSPLWAGQSGWITPAMERGRYVSDLISTLRDMPDAAASQALARLLQKQELKPWDETLRRAIFDQQITRRKALFKPASVEAICKTLANLDPTSTADLWALTLDHLQQLGRNIRDGNTNDYLQYWAGGKPQLEEACRDRLLSDLRARLSPLHINADPEGRYADAKRADIKVMANRHHIPIEIKRDMHRDLWKAITNQLVAKYTRDPVSEDHGIYLVFWFGGSGQPVAGDGGARPKSALELQQRLQSTVSAESQHKVAVLVIDCALPPASKSKSKVKP